MAFVAIDDPLGLMAVGTKRLAHANAVLDWHTPVLSSECQEDRYPDLGGTFGRGGLSQQLGILEEEIGAVLFERSGRGVKLTAAGQGLVAQAGKLFELRLRRIFASVRTSCLAKSFSRTFWR